MRTLVIGIAASGLLASAAYAQVPHALVPGTDQIVAPAGPTPQDTNPTPPVGPAGVQSGIAGNAAGSNDYPRPTSSAATGSSSPVSATTRDYPLSWNGSAQDWTMHSQACGSKYKGYDATTDMYNLRRGVKAMCPATLGLNK
jgi:hypothetical protein